MEANMTLDEHEWAKKALADMLARCVTALAQQLGDVARLA
jgi:hypothetical protein